MAADGTIGAMRRRTVIAASILCIAATVALLIAADANDGIVVRPEARAQTVPVPHKDDAADDPAIWIHPIDPAQSLILGTDKQGGLHSYNVDGSQHQLVSPTSHPDNVDVLYGFVLNGKPTDLAIASTRGSHACGIKIWSIDTATRNLTDITPNGIIRVFNGSTPYGSCTYRSAKSGQYYFFVNHKDGSIEQYQLKEKRGNIAASKVRSLKLKSTPEGCVADDELGNFFIAEERGGIWKFNAEPDGGNERTLIAKVDDHGLKPDVEGLTIYYAANGRGYLIASSQGSNKFKVYDRQAPHHFVLTIDPKSGKIDDVNDTDGIAVSNCPTSPLFPKGLLVVQDGSNSSGKTQNFKIYGWEDIAAGHLITDTSWNPRSPRQP
jgi:3-phytase